MHKKIKIKKYKSCIITMNIKILLVKISIKKQKIDI